MKTKNKGRFEAVILAVVIVVITAAVSVGVMASTGFFRSDKQSALELLAQAPEKLSRSYIDEHMGTQKLMKACMENGSSANIHLSDFKLSKEIMEEDASGFDLSKYEMQIDAQASADGKKASTLFNLSKGDDRLSVVSYTDEDKSCVAFPELSPGKVLTTDKKKLEESLSGDSYNLIKSRMEYLTSANYKEFGKAFEEFLKDEVNKVYKELSCEETEDDTYCLTVPKSTLDTVFGDFYSFMSEQKDTVDFINAYLEEEETGDFLTLLKKAVDKLTKESSDFTFYVKGKGKDLSKVSFDVTLDGDPYSFSMDFEGKEDCKAKLLLETTQDKEEISVEVVMKDEKAGLLKESIELNLLIDDISFGKFSYTTTIDPKDNKCNMELILNAEAEEVLRMEAEGLVKNLNPGKSVSYEMKKVSLGIDGEQLLTMAVDLTLGTLEGEIEPPKGEEIDMTDYDDPKAEEFSEELMQNGISLLSKWGLYDDEL